MGNKISSHKLYNLKNKDDIWELFSNINMLDGFYIDTRLSVSSKCLIALNNLMNDLTTNTPGSDILKNQNLLSKIERFMFHCRLIRHLAIVNSSADSDYELIELNNVGHLVTLELKRVPIKTVRHLKNHRATLIKFIIHQSIDNLECVFNCGGENWTHLEYLDVRDNGLKIIDDSVRFLASLKVLDISRNEIDDISFIQKIPTLTCLNASFNHIRSLPCITSTRLSVLIMGYNYLDSIKGIKGFKYLSTFDVSNNIIATGDHLNQLKTMDYLTKLSLKDNPLSYSKNYRQMVLGAISTQVSINFTLDGKYLSTKEYNDRLKRQIIFVPPALSNPNPIYPDVSIIPFNKNPSVFRSVVKWSMSNHSKGNNNDIIPLQLSEKFFYSNQTSDSEQGSSRFTRSPNLLSKLGEWKSTMDSNLIMPHYIGSKSSYLCAILGDGGCQSFVNVSVQILDHLFMAVNDTETVVDKMNLWQLLVSVPITTNEGIDANRELKLVFFEEYDSKSNGLMKLSTRNIIFSEAHELKTFSDQLDLYLRGRTIHNDDWLNLPLSKISMRCSNFHHVFHFSVVNQRPFRCKQCCSTTFVLQSTIHSTPLNAGVQRQSSTVSPSVQNLLLSKFPNITLEISTINEAGNSCLYGDARVSEQDEMCTYDKESLKPDGTSTGTKVNDSSELDLDGAINIKAVDVVNRVVPRECEEDNAAYALLKCTLRTRWIIHELPCGIAIHMHDNETIDSKLQPHLLTNVLQRQEYLLNVFQVYLVYRSKGMANRVLMVITSVRVIFFNILDNDSTCLERCIKLRCDLQLSSLRQLEYCVNYQWIELKLINGHLVTLMVGDIDSVKKVGQSIAEAIGTRAGAFSVAFSKEIVNLRCSELVSVMTSGLYDGVTMQSLSKSESYLIDSSSLLPSKGTSASKYSPKMIVIEAKHLFFITFDYSTNDQSPSFELGNAISLQSVNNEMHIDSHNDCLMYLVTEVNGQKTFLDIRFMSPHSRSKAAFFLSKMLCAIFMMDVMFILRDLSDI